MLSSHSCVALRYPPAPHYARDSRETGVEARVGGRNDADLCADVGQDESVVRLRKVRVWHGSLLGAPGGGEGRGKDVHSAEGGAAGWAGVAGGSGGVEPGGNAVGVEGVVTGADADDGEIISESEGDDEEAEVSESEERDRSCWQIVQIVSASIGDMVALRMMWLVM